MIRVSVIASSRCDGSSEKPGASSEIACGMNSQATASSTTCTLNSRVKMRSAKSRAASEPPSSCNWA